MDAGNGMCGRIFVTRLDDALVWLFGCMVGCSVGILDNGMACFVCRGGRIDFSGNDSAFVTIGCIDDVIFVSVFGTTTGSVAFEYVLFGYVRRAFGTLVVTTLEMMGIECGWVVFMFGFGMIVVILF